MILFCIKGGFLFVLFYISFTVMYFFLFMVQGVGIGTQAFISSLSPLVPKMVTKLLGSPSFVSSSWTTYPRFLLEQFDLVIVFISIKKLYKGKPNEIHILYFCKISYKFTKMKKPFCLNMYLYFCLQKERQPWVCAFWWLCIF